MSFFNNYKCDSNYQPCGCQNKCPQPPKHDCCPCECKCKKCLWIVWGDCKEKKHCPFCPCCSQSGCGSNYGSKSSCGYGQSSYASSYLSSSFGSQSYGNLSLSGQYSSQSSFGCHNQSQGGYNCKGGCGQQKPCSKCEQKIYQPAFCPLICPKNFGNYSPDFWEKGF